MEAPRGQVEIEAARQQVVALPVVAGAQALIGGILAIYAVGLLLSIGSNLWVVLIFPAWVCAISLFILASNLGAGSSTSPPR